MLEQTYTFLAFQAFSGLRSWGSRQGQCLGLVDTPWILSEERVSCPGSHSSQVVGPRPSQAVDSSRDSQVLWVSSHDATFKTSQTSGWQSCPIPGVWVTTGDYLSGV